MGLVAATYARDSSTSNSETSIERQEMRTTEYATRVNAVVVARFSDEDITGKTVAGRDGLASMIEAAEKGRFNLLIIEDVSRLSRDKVDASRIWDRLAACRIAVHEANGTVLDAESMALKAHLAEQEHATMLGRMQDGRTIAVAKGKMMGAPVFGFCRSQERAKEHVPHPRRMRVVQRIFRDIASGKSIPEVCAALTAEREMTPQDCKDADLGAPEPVEPTRWRYPMVRQIVEQTQYVGIVMDGRYRVVRDDDDYRITRLVRQDLEDTVRVYNPSLVVVDRKTWIEAQLAILPKMPRFQGPKHRHYFLDKEIFCGGCGRPARRAANNLERLYQCEVYCDGGLKVAKMGRIEGGILEAIASVWPEDLVSDASALVGPEVDKAGVVDELRSIRVELQGLIMASCRGSVVESALSMREHISRLEARAAELEEMLLREAQSPRPAVDVTDVPGRLRGMIGAVPIDLNVHREAELLAFVEGFVERVAGSCPQAWCSFSEEPPRSPARAGTVRLPGSAG